jgi:hypothetical protein
MSCNTVNGVKYDEPDVTSFSYKLFRFFWNWMHSKYDQISTSCSFPIAVIGWIYKLIIFFGIPCCYGFFGYNYWFIGFDIKVSSGGTTDLFLYLRILKTMFQVLLPCLSV